MTKQQLKLDPAKLGQPNKIASFMLGPSLSLMHDQPAFI